MNRAIMRTSPLVAAVALLVLTAFNSSAQVQPQPASTTGPANTIDSARIIHAFTTKEEEFRRALNSYSFKRDALIQSIGMGGQVIGEYHRVSNFTFDDQGNRYEKISFFPMPSMAEVTAEDIEDLGGVEPFALDPTKIDLYNIRYVGKEKIDELDLFIFDEDEEIEFVDLFFSDVANVVQIDLGRVECERFDATEILDVFSRDFSHRRHREETDLLVPISLIVEGEVGNAMILTDHLAPHADTLNQRVAFEWVAVERAAKFCFLRGESMNDESG